MQEHLGVRRLACAGSLVATVVLLGAVPANALASHVGCGDTITQSTTLDSDIVDCGADAALRIAADDVVLDLNGHTIDGVGREFTTGIAAPSANRVSIENGIVRQFGFGVQLGAHGDTTSSDNVARQLQIDTGSGGMAIYADSNRIEQITSTRTVFLFGSSGNVVEANPAPISLSMQSDDNLVQRNTGVVSLRESTGNRLRDNHFFSPSAVEGLFMIDAPSNVVEHNTASGTHTGFFLWRADRNQLRDNSVTNQVGIELFGSGGNVIEKNRLARSDRSGTGIQLTATSSANVVEKNTITGYFQGLLAEFSSSRNTVSKNELTDNTVALEFNQRASSNDATKNSIAGNAIGVSIDTGASANGIVDNVISGNIVGIRAGFEPEEEGIPPSSGNRIQRNSVLDSAQDGIWIVNATGTLIERNLANRNGDDGIDVFSASNTITANTANENRDLGIDASPGNTDGGSNRASGNGNPLQCRNVVCR